MGIVFNKCFNLFVALAEMHIGNADRLYQILIKVGNFRVIFIVRHIDNALRLRKVYLRQFFKVLKGSGIIKTGYVLNTPQGTEAGKQYSKNDADNNVFTVFRVTLSF